MDGLIQDYPLTIDRIIEHARRIHPHKRVSTMLPDGSMHRTTYGEMYRRIKRLSKALVKLGVKPGDRVATFAWNTYQHMELYFAIPGAGAVCHTLNLRLFAEQLVYIINHAEDKIVFIDGTLIPLYEKFAAQVPGVETYVLMNVPKGAPCSLPNVLYYEDLIEGSDEDFAWLSTDERAAAGLCYTSGTTGDPKGALYSHRSTYLHALAVNQASSVGLTERDVLLPVVPQFHVMAWGMPYAAPIAGADVVMPGPHLKPEPLARMIEGEKVTVAAGVPTIWTALYHEAKTNHRDLSSIRALVVGGSAMPRALTAGYERDLGVNVVHAWGMTEMSPIGTVNVLRSAHDGLDQEGKWDVKASQGTPVFGVEVRIIDENGLELPWDGASMGELQVRGPWIIRQYYKRDLAPENFTADGWFRTGDVVTMSADGIMTIKDRTKDLVKSGGEWISTVELESAIMGHPDVLEAAVIAVPDDKWSERPLAAVVVKPGSNVTSEAIIDYLSTRVAKFWLPDRVIFVAEVPKTSVGKFDKKVLRRRYAEGEL
ncbi:MAG: long-chain fatty acid--CoA ligase [Chloroflexi bacterium]|nr:long-chain fatty acid--CoA ligase [Chloroflexota bacterium]